MSFFTDKLKLLRKEKKLTQKEIAEQIGIKQNSYSDWETGKNEPNLENVVKLAKILDTTTDDLLGRTYYSMIDWTPFEKLEPINFKEATKEELDTLKHSIAVEYSQKKNLFDLKDELVKRWNLGEEDSKILNTIFHEVQQYWK